MDSLTANRAAVVASQEDEASSNLARLRRPANRSGELLDGIVVHGGRDERSPDRTRGDSVYADTPSDVLV